MLVALAEEALSLLHDIAKRKAEAGLLTASDGFGGHLLWAMAGLTGTIYPTLLHEVYEVLNLLLSDSDLREALVNGALMSPPPPAGSRSRRNPYDTGLLPMLLSGLHAAGWWGVAGTARRHLLPRSMENCIVTTLRHACAVQASILLPSVSAGPLPPPMQAAAVTPSGGGGGGAAGVSPTATPLFESLMLLLPAMYLHVKSASALSEGQRVAYEPLIAAAAVVDKILGDAEGAPSMVRALMRFLDGELMGAAAEMLAEICHPLFAAFLPSHSQMLAHTLTRLLKEGPAEWEEPIMLAVAYAMQHPTAPSFVDQFHLVVQLCVDGESDAAVYCLSSAMRAAARAGDEFTSQGMASGRPFDELSSNRFYQSEERELEQARDVLPNLIQVHAVMRG